MPSIKRNFAALHLVAFLLFAANASASAQENVIAAVVAKKLQASIDKIYEANPESIGLMIHVEAPDHGLSWSGTSGHADKGESKLTPDQPALIASNVKTYIAAAVLKLVEQKKLSVTDPIEGLISEKSEELLIGDGYDLSAITLAHLLSHTSGIHDYIDEGYMNFVIENPKHRWTRDEQIARSVEIGSPLGAPSDVFSYADVNFLLLGEILESKTGAPFYSAVRELVGYEKLGLDNTWFETLEDRPTTAKKLVHQYYSSFRFDSYEMDPSFDLYGAGGIAATPRDLALFSQNLFTGNIVKDPKVLDLIFTPAKTKDGVNHHYHFGLSSSEIEGHSAWGHGGFWGTVVQYVPDLNASISVFVLERDKRILRKEILESAVKILADHKQK